MTVLTGAVGREKPADLTAAERSPVPGDRVRDALMAEGPDCPGRFGSVRASVCRWPGYEIASRGLSRAATGCSFMSWPIRR
jgi:hypothetical protein